MRKVLEMTRDFTPPLRATDHCRHYSYKHGDLMSDRGPQCALGVDLSDPGASRACWSNPEEECLFRAEYTDDERAAWEAWTAEAMNRLGVAIDALPAPLKLNARGHIACPNCGGELHYGRWHRGAFVQCNTEHCCAARMNIAAGADWPARKEEAAQ